MKKLLFLALTLLSFSLHAENRMVDEHTIILDSYTSVKKDILYYYMDQSFPGLVDPVTIYVNGDSLRELTGLKLCNGQYGENYFAWKISTLIVRPTENTHVKILADADYALCIHGLYDLTIIGDNNLNIGLYGLGNYNSLSGNFGFEVANIKPRGQVISLSSLPNGKITLINFECYYGFCGVKLAGYFDTIVEFNAHNFYVHDTIDGEGFYLSSTQLLPVTKIKGSISYGIVARTGAEGLQLQHCSGFKVTQVNLFATATAWIRAFQQYQDTGIQWNCARGVNTIEDIIIDGYRSIAINCFTGDGAQATNKLTNVVISGGHGLPIAYQNSCTTNAHWYMVDVVISLTDGMYYKDTKVSYKQPPIYNVGTDVVTMGMSYNIEEQPVYVNSGFKNSDIQQWNRYYNGYLQSGNTTTPTVWRKGQIVIDVTEHKYNFFRCLKDHTTSSSLEPRNNPEYFTPVNWEGSNFPPDDLRLVNHNRVGIKYTTIDYPTIIKNK